MVKPSQQFVPIKEIRESVVILNDGSMRMILMASSLNFSLKSEDEQTAILSRYQSFLNSLDFSIQFFIESRKLDIRPYLETLVEAEKEQLNELLKIQTKEYIEFIKNFVSVTNIVSKTFYIVIPYSPSSFNAKGGFLANLPFMSNNSGEQKEISEDGRFLENKIQLQQRSDVVISGLSGLGVRVAPLNTEELIELYFKLFNPGEIEKGSISKQLATNSSG